MHYFFKRETQAFARLGCKQPPALETAVDVSIIMEPAKSFEDLLVWQKAHSFVLMIYRLTGTFPKQEIFGLTSQFRRAAVSIPANIAEGFRRRGKSDKARFFNIAQASLEECRYYLILTRDLEYADTKEAQRLIQEVSKLLVSYSKSILNSEV